MSVIIWFRSPDLHFLMSCPCNCACVWKSYVCKIFNTKDDFVLHFYNTFSLATSEKMKRKRRNQMKLECERMSCRRRTLDTTHLVCQ